MPYMVNVERMEQLLYKQNNNFHLLPFLQHSGNWWVLTNIVNFEYCMGR